MDGAHLRPAVRATGARVGYARVYVERASGAKADRPELNAALDSKREGDTLVVRRLDRLGRPLEHQIQLVKTLEGRKVNLRSRTEGVDTSTAGGRLVVLTFGAIAEFERELVQEHTHAALEVARAAGRKGGRKRKLSPRTVASARALLAERGDDGRPIRTRNEVAADLGISRATLYLALARDRAHFEARRTR